jgi:hypothetical protein
MAVPTLQARPEFVEFCMSEYTFGTVAKWFYSQLPRPHMIPQSMLVDEEDPSMQIWVDLSDHRDRRPILGGAVPVPGWAVPDVRVLQGVPLGTLPSLQRSLALPGTFDALERLCTDWCDSKVHKKPTCLPCPTTSGSPCLTALASSGTSTGLPTTAPGGPRPSACGTRASEAVFDT